MDQDDNRMSLSDSQQRLTRLRTWLLCAAIAAGASTLLGQDVQPAARVAPSSDDSPAPGDSDVKLNPNLATPTLGGRQFWADVEFFHAWRIQQNVLTSHYRLLGPDDVRQAWGTLEQCQTRLREIREEQKLVPMKGEAVILLHGIIRSSKSMSKLKTALEQAGYTVFAFDYPSTRVDIPAAAEYLQSVMTSLKGIERIHFVTHSMGGLVVRAWLAKHSDSRVGRLVMVATPNLGAHMADLLHGNFVYKLVFGPAGQQLIRDDEALIIQLPTPEFEFGIIAGGRGTPEGYNPLIPGDDDGTVSLESTRLPGAADFIVVRQLHTFILNAPETADYTVRFLKDGCFREKGDREPIARPEKTAANEHK